MVQRKITLSLILIKTSGSVNDLICKIKFHVAPEFPGRNNCPQRNGGGGWIGISISILRGVELTTCFLRPIFRLSFCIAVSGITRFFNATICACYSVPLRSTFQERVALNSLYLQWIYWDYTTVNRRMQTKRSPVLIMAWIPWEYTENNYKSIPPTKFESSFEFINKSRLQKNVCMNRMESIESSNELFLPFPCNTVISELPCVLFFHSWIY
jgi:hypothetical protein